MHVVLRCHDKKKPPEESSHSQDGDSQMASDSSGSMLGAGRKWGNAFKNLKEPSSATSQAVSHSSWEQYWGACPAKQGPNWERDLALGKQGILTQAWQSRILLWPGAWLIPEDHPPGEKMGLLDSFKILKNLKKQYCWAFARSHRSFAESSARNSENQNNKKIKQLLTQEKAKSCVRQDSTVNMTFSNPRT